MLMAAVSVYEYTGTVAWTIMTMWHLFIYLLFPHIDLGGADYMCPHQRSCEPQRLPF